MFFETEKTQLKYDLSFYTAVFLGGESHVIQRERSLPNHEVAGRGLRADYLRRCDRLLRRRHKQVPVDGEDSGGRAPQGHQGEYETAAPARQ